VVADDDTMIGVAKLLDLINCYDEQAIRFAFKPL
jgi:hypothetical protein